MLIKVQTNGSLLSERRNQEIFEKRRPHKIVISFYGGKEKSYQSLTRTPGSFKLFLKAVDWLKKSGIRVRANIIVTKYNALEIGRMVGMATDSGFEYFIYPRLTPTFQGDRMPMELAMNNCSVMEEIDKYNRQSIPQERNKERKECLAGRAFFHVDWNGSISICQSSRNNPVNLLREGMSGFMQLAEISRRNLKRLDKCVDCEYGKECSTCPLNLELFQKADRIPSYICKKYGH